LRADSRARANTGNTIAASIPMIAMTTNSSIRVNPRSRRHERGTAALPGVQPPAFCQAGEALTPCLQSWPPRSAATRPNHSGKAVTWRYKAAVFEFAMFRRFVKSARRHYVEI
jgi:hypothetical protein